MRPVLLTTVTLALVVTAIPVASADHTYWDCMNNIWQPSPPPGWNLYCSTAGWAAHNPYVPMASCAVSKLHIEIVGVWYDVPGGLACLGLV